MQKNNVKLNFQNEKSWLLGTHGVHSIEHKPNLLCIWVTGKHSKIMENLSKELVFNHTKELLHKFLDKYYNVTEPNDLIRSSWFTNPHFKGTYSYRSIETENNNIWAKDLEEPINNLVS